MTPRERRIIDLLWRQRYGEPPAAWLDDLDSMVRLWARGTRPAPVTPPPVTEAFGPQV